MLSSSTSLSNHAAEVRSLSLFRRLHRRLIKCHRCAIFRSTLIALYQAIAQFAERLRHKNISAYLLISCFFFISLYPDKSGIRQLQKVKLEHNENN